MKDMSKKSFILALLFVIFAIEVYYGIYFLFIVWFLNIIFFLYIPIIKTCNYFIGHSISMESVTKDDAIVVCPCQTKKDCLRNIRSLPCGPSVVTCFEGYCRCNHNQKSGIQICLFFTIKHNMLI